MVDALGGEAAGGVAERLEGGEKADGVADHTVEVAAGVAGLAAGEVEERQFGLAHGARAERNTHNKWFNAAVGCGSMGASARFKAAKPRFKEAVGLGSKVQRMEQREENRVYSCYPES